MGAVSFASKQQSDSIRKDVFKRASDPNDGTCTTEGQTPFCAKKGTAKAIPFSLVAEAGFEPTTFGL